MSRPKWCGELKGNNIGLAMCLSRVLSELDKLNKGCSSFENQATAIVNYLHINKIIKED